MNRLVALTLATLTVTGCALLPSGVPEPSTSGTTDPTPTHSATADAPVNLEGPVQPTGTATAVASGLDVPWSILRLASGSTLISERGTGIIKEVTAEGLVRDVATIPGMVPEHESGLLGLASLDDKWIYAYFTTAKDNRIMRFPLLGEAGNYSLDTTPGQLILSGIRKERKHDGGRIKFGPDGMLYATVGDAAVPALAQDPKSLNGKILRMTPIGAVPDDNPTPGSYVYSMGHRNPQGLTWDDRGRMWAAELGQGTWDEFNRIVPGANYGWPLIEGVGHKSGYVDPVAVWDTDDASPSGLVYTRGTFFMASLRGQRIWAIYPDGRGGARTVAFYVGEYGRLRDVAAGPDGTLWFTTSNRDLNGTRMRLGGDYLWEVDLEVIESE